MAHMLTAANALLWADLLKKVSHLWIFSSLIVWVGSLRWSKVAGDALDATSSLLQLAASVCDHAPTLRPGGGTFSTGIKVLRRAAQSSKSVDVVIRTLTTKLTAYSAFAACIAIAASCAAISQGYIRRIMDHGLSLRSLLVLAMPGMAIAMLFQEVDPNVEWPKEPFVALQQQAAPVIRAILVIRATILVRNTTEAVVLCMQTVPLIGVVATWLAHGEIVDPIAPVVASAVAVALVAYHLASKRTFMTPLIVLGYGVISLAPQTVDLVAKNTDLDPKLLHHFATMLNCVFVVAMIIVGATSFCLGLIFIINLLFKLNRIPLNPFLEPQVRSGPRG